MLVLASRAGARRGPGHAVRARGPRARSSSSPPDDARIMMRWWWFGPTVTKAGLEREMRLMKDGGIGGFEIQPVYPVVLDDPARGLRDPPVPLGRFPRPRALRRREGAGTRPARRPHARQRLAVRRAAGRRRRTPPGNCGSSASPCPPGPRARRCRTSVPGERADGGVPGAVGARDDDREGLREVAGIADGLLQLPDRSPHAREVLFFISSRTGMMVKRPAVGAEGFVLNHYDRAAVDHYLRVRRRPPALGVQRGAALRRVLRQPGGVRVRLDRRLPRRVQGAPRLRPAPAPARARAGCRAGDRGDPPRLGPDADGTAQRALPRSRCSSGRAQPRNTVPRPGLRHPAGHHLEQRRHRPARRRGRAVEDAARVAVGRVHRPPLRPARHLVGNVDVAALAVVQSLAPRREGGGRPALPAGHQPA
ncbi:MAG: hypothetical protein MZW92_42365 [Comamonadaceae bacterium]|nr:hypothetical protein [Comamonadaceae bacterium]